MTRKSARAFTLVELMVVVTIMTVLMAMLLPAMEGAIEEARKASCASNLHAIHIGVYDYGTHNNGAVPIVWDVGNGVRCQIAIGTEAVQQFSTVGLATPDTATHRAYVQSTDAPFDYVDRTMTPHWTCPSRGFTSTWVEPFANTRHLILGYQYMGGVDKWRNRNNPGMFDSYSPVTLQTSKGGWVLGADTTIRFGQGTGASAGWGKGVSNTYAGMPSHKSGPSLVPSGGNQVHVEGSVAWIPFPEMFWYHSWGNSRPAFFYQVDNGGYRYESAKDYMK